MKQNHGIDAHSVSPSASHSASWYQFTLLSEQGYRVTGIGSLSRAISQKVSSTPKIRFTPEIRFQYLTAGVSSNLDIIIIISLET